MLKISAVILCLICLQSVDALPHCQRTELPEHLIQGNKVHVIYTMKSSCKLCAQKAAGLPNLKASLQRAGINVNFIVAVSNNSTRLPKLDPHISINKMQVWKSLGEQNNHFYIIDRCGRLVYEIINPWSSLQMPFLRGAIVATTFSHPCGLCPQDYVMVTEENIKMYPPMVEEDQSHPEEVPLDIIMRLRHVHQGDPNVYNHIVMAAHGFPGHHQHLPHETVTKQKSKSTFSLNVEQDNKETNKVSSISSEVISDISGEKKLLDAKQTSVSNSINNLGYNSLRMANETRLLLGTNETTVSMILNTAPNETNKETNLTEQSDYLESSTGGNTTNEETSSGYDYAEDPSGESESVYEDSQLTSDELAEKESLKEHYKKILDWVNFNN